MSAKARTLIRVVLILAVFAILLFFFQNRLIFFPSPWPSAFKLPEQLKFAGLSPVTITTSDNVALNAIYATPLDSARKKNKLILINHGNAGNLINRLDRVDKFCELGFSVLVYDYRGFGLSSGTPDVAGAIKDGRAALTFLKQTFNYANAEIIIYGESLGTGIAAELVRDAEQPFAALVLESGFASLSAQANRRFPGFGRLILVNDLPTLTTLQQYHGKLMIIHSKNDEIIPYSDSEKLFNACPSPQKKLVTLEGPGHNDAVWLRPEYESAWETFFAN